jgi:hypothetical protein
MVIEKVPAVLKVCVNGVQPDAANAGDATAAAITGIDHAAPFNIVRRPTPDAFALRCAAPEPTFGFASAETERSSKICP